MKKHYIDVRGKQIHLLDSGTDQSLPTLVLIHQVPSHAEMFRAVMKHLQSRFRLIAPDLPGFGQSDPIPDFDIHELAELTQEALAKHIGQPYYLLGHHAGSTVATDIAFHQSNMIKGLILSGPTWLDQSMQQKLLTNSHDYSPQANGRHLTDLWQMLRKKDEDCDLSISSRELCSALALGDWYQLAYRAVALYPFKQRLTQLGLPLAFLFGDKDVFYPKLDGCRDRFPDAKFEIIENGTTYLFESQSQKVADAIKLFIDEMESAAHAAEKAELAEWI